jgi:hypothetical protein
MVTVNRRGVFRWDEIPQVPMRHGTSYTLRLAGTIIRDAAGNTLSDSTVVVSFQTLGKDTLGQLSGSIARRLPSEQDFPLVLTATPVRGGAVKNIVIPIRQDQFMLDLLPGYYTLSAFLDRNGNGVYDFGSVMPYTLAEPFCSSPDTVRVRSRFESAGVLLEFQEGK